MPYCDCCHWPEDAHTLTGGRCRYCTRYCGPDGHKVFIREAYQWGDMPTLRRPDGTLEFHIGGGRVLTDKEELRTWILDVWRPASLDGQNLYCRLAAGLDL